VEEAVLDRKVVTPVRMKRSEDSISEGKDMSMRHSSNVQVCNITYRYINSTYITRHPENKY
jgi:hypothetical protein